MQPTLSTRAQRIQPSLTLAISAKAKAMRADGIDVLDFSAGEPDFDTPGNIRQAACAAIEEGFTKYTAAGGIPEVKDAIIAKYQREQEIAYSPSQVLVSNGGKHALHSIFQAMLDPGDEVLIPSPYWLSYPDMVKLSGGMPVVVPTRLEEGFKMSAAALAAAVTPRTKLVILNSPSNPTGAVYTADELTSLSAVIEAAGIMVISDDVYEKFVFDGQSFVNLPMVAPQLTDRVIIINSASKTYAMPGWRIGFALGSEAVIQAATRIQGQATSCAGSISQKALAHALQVDTDLNQLFRRHAYETRRNLMFDGLADIPGIKVFKPSGAFYIFADVGRFYGHLSGVSDSVSFCAHLLEKYRIAAIPGIAFGADTYIRFSFVTDEASIRDGLVRLAELSSTSMTDVCNPKEN
jgi:aspartate aminotransferase